VSDKRYPIAETFTSVQGEGLYTGTLMHFIRLAGCNVGKYDYDEIHQRGASMDKTVQGLNLLDEKLFTDKKHSICETVFGQRFPCDTNYHKCYDASVKELIDAVGPVEHICLTGGEPFLHDLQPLVDNSQQREVHIETSGTLPIPHYIAQNAWLTCSPKAGLLAENVPLINEWKFVVSCLDDVDKVERLLQALMVPDDVPVYIQPINHVNAVDTAMMDMVLAALLRHPQFRLSAQLHKFLEVR